MSSPGDALTDRVQQLFREALTMEVPSADTDLIETGRLDSLGLVELLFALEQHFEVDLSLGELDVENFRTLRRISDFVAAQKGQ